MPRDKKTGRVIARWVVALAVIGGGIWWWIHPASSAPTVYKYETAPITEGDVTAVVTATATLVPVTKVTVGSEASGVIRRILVDFNSHVHRGQILAEIDPSVVKAQIDQNKAALLNTMSTYNQQVAHESDAQAGVAAADAGIATARAQVQTATATMEGSRASMLGAAAQVEKSRADLENTRLAFQRDDALFAKDLVAHADLDTARSVYLQSKATLEASQAALRTAQATFRSNQASLSGAKASLEAAVVKRQSAVAQVAGARAQVAAARALVEQARATLEASEVLLRKTIIRSPVDGVVLECKVSVGQAVQASYTTPELFTLAENLDVMRLETAVDEADVGKVHEGDTVSFTVDAFPDDTFTGKVTQVRQSPQAAPSGSTQTVVNYTAVVETQNAGHKLRPGMTATVKIQVAQRKKTLLIPNAALRFKPPDEVAERAKPSTSPHGASGSPAASPSAAPSASPAAKHEQPIWMISPTNSQDLVQKTVTLGITDGNNTELINSPVKKGDAVVTSAEAVGQKKSDLPTLR